MIEGIFSESDDSESFIPSSNFEPPPPVDCILQKSRTSQDSEDMDISKRPMNREPHSSSMYATQPDGTVSPDTFCSRKPSVVPHSPLPENSQAEGQNSTFSPSRPASSSILIENYQNIDPDQLMKPLFPALTTRASVPTSISSKIAQPNILDFRSQVNTEFNSNESLGSVSLGVVTNTTSSHTPRSGSDLFKSDSSIFREPLVPPRRRNVASISTNTTNEELDSSSLFLFTLSLSVNRLPSRIEKADDVEFKVPDFAKAVTWQFRLRRMDENAAASISDAAGVLADSFGDWMSEYLPSQSDAFHSDYIRNPPTSVAPIASIPNARVSSSSSEYFTSRKVIPESTIESSELDTHSDAVSKPMEQSSDHKRAPPEGEVIGTSGNRISTSSSEYFLPRKLTANKRKLDRVSIDTPESVMCEANAEIQPDVASSILPPEPEPQNASQSRASTSSSEYFIPLKKSAMRIAKPTDRETADAVEMDAWLMSDKTLEPSTLSQQEPSAAGKKRTKVKKASSAQDPISEAASQVEEKTSIANLSVSEPGPRSILRFRKGRSANTSRKIQGRKEIQEFSIEPSLRVALRDGASHTTDSQGKPKSFLKTKTAMDAEEIFETTILDSTAKVASNFTEELSDASTIACKLEPESPVPNIEPIPSPSKNDSSGATESARTRSGRAKKALAEDTPRPYEAAIQRENLMSPPDVSITDSEQLTQLTPMGKLRSTSGNAASGEDEEIYVYAKWGRSRYFYAGQIIKKLRGGRFRIMFEDKATVTVADHNVVLTELLPLGSRVEVDINGTGEFAGDYVVSGHAVGTKPPSYIVKRFVDNDVNQVPRCRVAIHADELEELFIKGQVCSIAKLIGVGPVEISGQAGDASTPLSTFSKRSGHRVRSSGPATPEMSAQLAISSAVHRKRSLNEMNETMECGSVKTTTTTTKKKVSRVASFSSKKQQQGRSRKSPPSRFNRRNSQIMLAGRRIVTRASRTSRLLGRKQVSSSSISRSASTHPVSSFGKRRKVSTKSSNTSDSSLSPPTIKSGSSRRSSVPRFFTGSVGDSSMMELDSETFEQTCRKYDIPIPQSDLFSHWAFVLSTSVRSAHPDKFHLTCDDPAAGSQLYPSENAFFLRKLMGTSGGRDIGELAVNISSTGCLEDGRHIALIAPAARRTLKYLQALATLGRVPLVHPVWVLDSCLLAAGRRPIVTPQEVVAKIVNMKIKPSDLPQFLLRLAPRGLYELPRGVNKISNQLVPPTIFPPIFVEPDHELSSKTLLELGGYTSSKIVAIVTNDSAKFGAGWVSILRHAMLTEADTELPSILSPEESLSRLQAIKMSKVTSILGRGLKIVLADQDRIPEPTIAEIRNMGFVVVNKEFLIQSLINGKVLDLKYATAWRN